MEAAPSTRHTTATDLPPETLAYFQGDDLRARVFHDKYALRDPEGRVLERTPPEMWRRIARELASVEPPEKRTEWEEKFYWLLDDFRFIPGGRIMHGAGNPKRVTLLNCFPAGTPILTKRGFVPIQHVLPGDEALTHRNRFKLVTDVLERQVDEPLVELSLWYLGDQPVRCTKDHRFLVRRADGQISWVRAADLTSSDYVRVGRTSETIPFESLDLQDYLEGGALDDNGHVYTATPYVGHQGAIGVKESRRVKRRVVLDERFGRWLGYFVAEGGVTSNNVYFTFSKDERVLTEEVVQLTRDVFGVDPYIQTREDQPSHWMRVCVGSKVLARFIKNFFNGGTKSSSKQLPAWFLCAPLRTQRAFIGAVFAGDGVVMKSGVKLFLANPQIVRQIFAILARLNVVASIRWEGMLRFTEHQGMWLQVGTQQHVRAIKSWIAGDHEVEASFVETDRNHFYKVVDGELFVKVKSVRPVPSLAQTVYDLAVEEDHSFVAGFACVHNCYVLPVKEDSIEAIFEWMKEAARTYSFGGGVGGDISILRPRGAPVNNAARSSTGAVSFMELMSLTTGTIGQSGRRGALMITIADNHPDVLDFTRVKRNLDKVRYANISVRVSDAFMRAVEEDALWDLVFENERAQYRQTIRARELWNELIRGARDYAEPGVIFWDTVKRWSTSEYNGMGVITTNPCSEVPLDPYNCCDLGNLSLAHFVRDEFTPQASVDWQMLEPALRYATRFLDNVLDYNAERHPLPDQKEASLRSRRIGVGFTGLGDMLIKLGLKYDTEEAIAFVDRLFDRIKNVVYDESVNLALEKGTFPAYDSLQHFQSPFLHALAPAVLDRIQAHGLRNVALLTVPPVGSGAALAGVTSGIEPIFDLSYIRRSESLSQEFFKVYHPLVREYMERTGITREEDLPDFFVTAHQIAPELRVKMQATIQKHIDHSISSTVNLPRDVPLEEVERIYFLAWKLGAKGITVYREGSRQGILITEQQAQATGVTVPTPVAAPAAVTPGGAVAEVRPSPRPRPKVTSGRTERIETPRGRIYVVVNEDEMGICEVFVHSFDVEAEGIGRLTSLALRAGVDPREIIEQLWRVQSKEVALDRSSDGTVVRVTTIAQAVALGLGRALYGDGFRPDKEFPRAQVLPDPLLRTRQERLPFERATPLPGADARVAEGNGEVPAPIAGAGFPLEFVGICPDCGATLIHENGCATCRSCGYAKC